MDGVQEAQCGAERAALACSPSLYLDFLNSGIANGATFLEVWPGDAGQYSSSIATAHGHLVSNGSVHCQYPNGDGQD